MELPQYTLKPHNNRMVVPWIFGLLMLSILFYFGIYFNVKFALQSDVPPSINMFIMAFCIVIVVFQLVRYHIQFAKYQYLFYADRIEFQGKKTKVFMLKDTEEITVKKNIFDNMFKTGSIKLSKKFKVGPIINTSQMQAYIQKLVDYNRKYMVRQ